MFVREVLFSLIVFQTFAAALAAPPEPADTVFRGGGVYTVDAARSWAEAVAVRAGRIVYVGTDAGVAPWIGPRTRSIDLKGRMLLPGFHDSHVHLIGGGIELGECDLNGLVTLEQILDAVKKFAERHPEKKWIRGGGWPLTLEGGNPHKALLDKIVPDRPVLLDAFDGHSSWVNSRALELAGITKETADPARGRIERDPETGEPTGTLRESAARLVINKTPPYSHEEFVTGLRRGLQMANRFGITSVQEAQVTDQHLKALAELDQSGELTVRTVAAMRFDPAKGMAQIPQFVEWREKFQGKRLRTTAVKIFEDGVIESRTAALLKPYLGGQKEESGWLNLEPEVLKPVAAELDRLGFQIHVHAIGDRAIQTTFDALEFARDRNGRRDSRHHIAHIQLFDPPDIARFRRLGVVANFQPLWASADKYIVDMTLPVLGPERSRWLYPIRSVANTGAVIACGSDWSVTSMNPLDAIRVAVTRRGMDEGPGPAWLPEQVVDLPLMIAGYTINGAYVNFEETETGSIEVGKAADLIVLDRNLFEIPAIDIHKAKVLLTLLEGKEVFRDASFTETAPPEKTLPMPGKVFRVEGQTAFVILPEKPAADGKTPWVWYAPTLPGLPGNEERWMFERFTKAGIAIAGIDVGESFGSPDGRKLFSAFYRELTEKQGFAPKPVLLGRSRGGLMTLGWAVENADKVGGFAGIYPVCNIASYPGVARASGAFHLTPDELTKKLDEHNPLDRLAELAKAKVPLFAIHGDVDQVVPLDANSGEVRKRYEKLGGEMQLIVPAGQGHNMWPGFFQCQELVDFVIANAQPKRATAENQKSALRIGVFRVDATPPLGTPVAYALARKIEDPLSARGVVLLGAGQPIVLCAVDWIGIANGGHDAWRESLAHAVGTSVDRVAVHVLHQHDGVRCDFSSEELLAPHGLTGKRFDVPFVRKTIANAALAAKASLEKAQPVTHLGIGEAKVDKVASNRRILGPNGRVAIARSSSYRIPEPILSRLNEEAKRQGYELSASRVEEALAAPEGVIDPLLKMLTFFDGDRPLVSLSYYATHPQSYFGQGDVTAEFVGLARTEHEQSHGDLPLIHFNGASGNVAAGKYNDGTPETRVVLTKRMADGMKQARAATKKIPLTAAECEWRVQPVRLPVATYLDADKLRATLENPQATEAERLTAAGKLAYVLRRKQDIPIELSCLKLGNVYVLHMPGELFVEYQLAAQQMRPTDTACMAAYGDVGTGYIGTEIAYSQGGYETQPSSSNTAPQVERVLIDGIRALLK